MDSGREPDLRSPRVVVGTDGSEGALGAVRWAAREAARYGWPLHLVHAWLWPLMHVPLGPAPGAPADAGLRGQADRVLAEARCAAAQEAPGVVHITSELVVGDAAVVLVRLAGPSDLLVLGNRGLGGFAGLLLGSTGTKVSSSARGAVVIARGDVARAERYPVVVGVAPGPLPSALLDEAAERAVIRGVPLLLAHAWTLPAAGSRPGGDDHLAVLSRGERLGRDVLAAARAYVGAAHPGLELRDHLGARSPAAELNDLSRAAQLIVVGSRGLGPVTGALLGSTTHALVNHADCPVLVHRPPTGSGSLVNPDRDS